MGGTIRLEIGIETTPMSRTVLSIVYNNTVLNTTVVEGPGNYTMKILLDKPGEYRLVVNAETMY